MRVARGRVVNGAVITEAQLPEGAEVAILVGDDGEFDLDPDDEDAIASALSSLAAGQGKPIAELKRKLGQPG